jgi:hypothetical protein
MSKPEDLFSINDLIPNLNWFVSFKSLKSGSLMLPFIYKKPETKKQSYA